MAAREIVGVNGGGGGGCVGMCAWGDLAGVFVTKASGEIPSANTVSVKKAKRLVIHVLQPTVNNVIISFADVCITRHGHGAREE